MNGGDGLAVAVADADQKQRERRGGGGWHVCPLAGPARGKEGVLISVLLDRQTWFSRIGNTMG